MTTSDRAGLASSGVSVVRSHSSLDHPTLPLPAHQGGGGEDDEEENRRSAHVTSGLQAEHRMFNPTEESGPTLRNSER